MSDNSLQKNCELLVLEPIQTLRTIDATRDLLVQNLVSGSRLSLDCSNVAEADVSIVQLLLSARKTAAQCGASLGLVAVSPVLADVVERSGIPQAAANDAFWNGGAP